MHAATDHGTSESPVFARVELDVEALFVAELDAVALFVAELVAGSLLELLLELLLESSSEPTCELSLEPYVGSDMGDEGPGELGSGGLWSIVPVEELEELEPGGAGALYPTRHPGSVVLGPSHPFT